MTKKSSTKSWYGVRSVTVHAENKPWGPDDLEPGEKVYDERITLWRAKSFKKAIALAEAERSDLDVPDYLDRFFDTGAEVGGELG